MLAAVNLSEALERARRQRLGEPEPFTVIAGDKQDPPGMICPRCGTVGFPELVDLVRSVVELSCPACEYAWQADRSQIPTA